MVSIHFTNTTIYNVNGLCNHIFRNLVCSEISKKYNLKFSYIAYGEMEALGLHTFIDGKFFYDTFIDFDENDFRYYIQNNIVLKQNIHVHHCYFQNPFIANYLYDYFRREEIKNDILKANQFKDRYCNNNDLIIHIRLTDSKECNPGLEYYENMLKKTDPYENGYLATDEIDHSICKYLIEKYGFIPLEYNAVDTIKFGSTCNQMILSGGTFSWMIGALGYDTKKIFCPDYNKYPVWHGDIFVFDHWIKDT
jgi:hypothetical protein